jgi:hypothetical protein
MRRISQLLGRMARTSVVAVIFGSLVSCSTFEESGLPGSAASMARNQIMWVRKEPPTFGHYRLTSLERIYPDLAYFVARRGMPDFLAEFDNRGRNYFILYYMKSRHAYAFRPRLGHRNSIEVSGPNAITDKEYAILDDYRTGKTR